MIHPLKFVYNPDFIILKSKDFSELKNASNKSPSLGC